MKKFILPFFIIGIIVLSLSRCVVTQEYHFNNDFSGKSSTQIDMTSLMGFLSTMDSTGDATNSLDTLEILFAEATKELRSLGATNVSYKWTGEDKSIVNINYEFPNVKTLNKIMAKSNTGTLFAGTKQDEKSMPKFTRKGRRKLIFKGQNFEKTNINLDENSEEMFEYYKFITIISFDRKIKRLEGNYELSEDKKSIKIEKNLKEISSEKGIVDFEIKLK